MVKGRIISESGGVYGLLGVLMGVPHVLLQLKETIMSHVSVTDFIVHIS